MGSYIHTTIKPQKQSDFPRVIQLVSNTERAITQIFGLNFGSEFGPCTVTEGILP